MSVTVVNMIPLSMSGETNQDSEPNLAVNPANPRQLVATAFTPAPLGGSFAPVYVSTDGGQTWALNTIVPGNGSVGTADITVAFGTSGGVLYAGTLNGTNVNLNILRTASFAAPTPMTLLESRANEDQPWTTAVTAAVGGGTQDRVYVGNNDFNQPAGATATVDLSTNAATAPALAGFAPHGIEHRTTAGQDGPPIRLAAHASGIIYAAFERWDSTVGFPNFTFDVVVTRDDSWGSGGAPFTALKDSGDGAIGQRVVTGRFAKWNDLMGQERLGADLTIAVDPTNSASVWIAWCDRVGGAAGTDWTLHVNHSTDHGQTWSADVRTITNAKNPCLAVNNAGRVGLLYQLFTGTNWATNLELTANGWTTPATTVPLHTASASTPASAFQPYIGDYLRLLAVGTDFYGVFSANNTPNPANFPSGIRYQRNANWATHTLLSTDNRTPVAVSIDAFFVHYAEYSPVYQQGDPGNGIGGYDLRSAADQVFAFDYDGSGKQDHLALYRPGTGTMWILKNTGGVFSPVYQQGDPGNGIGGYDLRSPADRAFAFDYDGSGKQDHLALYRPGTGTMWILKNTGGVFSPVYQQGDPGNGIGGYDLRSPADRAFAFDYDGSGKQDHLALYRPGTGTMWILKNTGGVFSPVYQQGDPGNGIGGYDLRSPADRAFAFDYDGSGKQDHLALYRPGTGTMWILKNTGGVFSPVYQQGDPGNGIGGYDLRSPADRAFAFDYDGSGKQDHLALYRPGTGTMWILKNTGGVFSPVYQQGDPGNGIGGYDLRSPADQAFAFDYDGSGKLDHPTLYRPGTGTIWILRK